MKRRTFIGAMASAVGVALVPTSGRKPYSPPAVFELPITTDARYAGHHAAKTLQILDDPGFRFLDGPPDHINCRCVVEFLARPNA